MVLIKNRILACAAGERLRSSDTSPRRLGGLNVQYKIIVTYGVLDLDALRPSFFKQSYLIGSFVPLLWSLRWVQFFIELRYWLGHEFVDIKSIYVEVV